MIYILFNTYNLIYTGISRYTKHIPKILLQKIYPLSLNNIIKIFTISLSQNFSNRLSQLLMQKKIKHLSNDDRMHSTLNLHDF